MDDRFFIPVATFFQRVFMLTIYNEKELFLWEIHSCHKRPNKEGDSCLQGAF